MKRKILYLLGLLALIIPVNVKADATQHIIEIECDKYELKPSETASCTIKGKSETTIDAIDGYLQVDTDLEVIEASIDGIWELGDAEADAGEEDIHFAGASADDDVVVGEYYNIGTFKIKASSNTNGVSTKFTYRAIKVTEHEDKTTGKEQVDVELDNVAKNIRIMSTVNTLDDLKLDDVTIEGFSKDKTSYDITVASDKTSIAISADKTNTSSTVTGDIGTKTLNYGINTFNIKVISESGAVKTYTLKINRPDNRSSEKYLLQFAFKDLDIKFDKATTGYKNNINNKYQKLAICGGEYKVDLPNILCIDADNVKFSDKASINGLKFNGTDIRKIFEEIDEYEEKCNDDKTECAIIVNGKEIEKYYYNPDTDEEFMYMVLGDLKEGNNQLIVTVQAENETEQDYTFTLNRLNEKGEDVSDNNITNPDTNTSSYILITFMLLGVGLILYKKYKKPIYR